VNISLEGQVALITGGSRGIGEATALGFAKMGADVVVASRKLPDLERVAEEIRQLGRKSVAVAAHIGKMDQLKDLVTRTTEELGRIDILVNNAGTSPAMHSALDVEEGLWDVIMNLNLKGLFFLSQAAARVMKEHGGGKIINVTSMVGFRPRPGNGIYGISKAGVIAATKLLAQEWAQYNIRVNAIAPGNVHTRLGDQAILSIPGYEEQINKKTPLGRMGEPDEIVGAMIYLASDASSFVTGETLVVDGGRLATL
jgi:NAD(P)-dependent dehydrogenase (short-subunit alcohol dehydrogenase family)